MPETETSDRTPIGLLRECQERRLEREGVPMVLALVDERQRSVESQNPAIRAEGAAYAELLDLYRRALVPSSTFRDGDEGALITALVVLAYAHFTTPYEEVAR